MDERTGWNSEKNRVDEGEMMGMYDYVDLKWECPVCKKEVNMFQIKDRCVKRIYVPGKTKLERMPWRYRIEGSKRIHYIEAVGTCWHSGDPSFFIFLYIPVNDDLTLSGDTSRYIVFYIDYEKHFGRDRDER